VLAYRLLRGRKAAGLTARTGAAALKDGRAARAKEEMPLDEKNNVSQVNRVQLTSQQLAIVNQSARHVGYSPLEHLVDDKERSVMEWREVNEAEGELLQR
jgi:hypothetical protein